MKTPWEIELIKPEQKWEITLSNKVSYVLPIASPEQLGGVKPDSKTLDMDIPVAVDEEGKLWTKDKIDETLSIKGFSADAAAVGEALKNIKVDGFVSYTEQTLTDEQKQQVQDNIGFGGIDAVELAGKMGLVSPVAAEDGAIYTDENGAIYSL